MGLVHRDVKPANVLLAGVGACDPWAGRPMLVDFGLALGDGTDATLTAEGQVLGTPA